MMSLQADVRDFVQRHVSAGDEYGERFAVAALKLAAACDEGLREPGTPARFQLLAAVLDAIEDGADCIGVWRCRTVARRVGLDETVELAPLEGLPLRQRS